MKVKIDSELCTGCGLCVDTAPTVFEMAEDKAIVIAEEVPAKDEENVTEAMNNCPVEAISIA